MKNNIEKLRKEMGLTQQALGEKLEDSRQTIISLESGKYNPSLILAYNLSVVFNCTIEDIFDFKGE